MAAPQYSPSSGSGTIYTDNSGTSYLFNGSIWNQISTGSKPMSTGEVLGASTSISTPFPTSPTPSGGGSSDPDLSNPVKRTDYAHSKGFDSWEQYLADQEKRNYQGPSQADLDAAYNPILNVYNQAESNLRGQLPGLISEAEAQAAASAQLLANQRQSADEQLGLQQSQTEAARQAQEAKQRQTFQELGMANRQRFGGASSAGQAASEIQGREFQRNQYEIGQQAQQAIQQINVQKQAVERDYSQKVFELDNNKKQALNELNRTFQDRLLQINSGRAATESEKAQARMSELQRLRDQAFQIQAAETQFRQQLELQAQQTRAELDALAMQYGQAAQGAVGAGGTAASQFGSYTPIPASTVSTQTTGSTNPQLTGQMSRRDDEYNGSILGKSTDRIDYGNPIANWWSGFVQR